MKISELIDVLIYYKKEYGDIDVKKCSSFIGSDNIDTAFMYEDNLVLVDSEKESHLSRFTRSEDNVL